MSGKREGDMVSPRRQGVEINRGRIRPGDGIVRDGILFSKRADDGRLPVDARLGFEGSDPADLLRRQDLELIHGGSERDAFGILLDNFVGIAPRPRKRSRHA